MIFFILVPKIPTLILKLNLLFVGALFGPAMTKWYQFLNRIKFPSPTKGVIYRVSSHFPFDLYYRREFVHNIVLLFIGLAWPGYPYTRLDILVLQDCTVIQKKHYFIVAVAFFYSSMSVLEGKPEEAFPRVQAVRHGCYFSLILFLIYDLGIRTNPSSQLVSLLGCC